MAASATLMAGPVVGIDFGTSNSTVGLVAPDGVSMVPLEGAHNSIPTCIFFNMEEGETSVHFGRDAMQMYRDGYQGRLLRSLKSILGTALAQDSTAIGFKSYKLADVLALFLRHLRTQAEAVAGRPIERAVIGRPVFFVDDDAAADQQAQNQLQDIASRAGFKQIAFQYEPIAAALAYESTLQDDQTVLIADIGGGTADFSVIHLSPRRKGQADRAADILGNIGVHIGGTDLDRLLSFKGVMPALGLGSLYKHKALEMPSSPYHMLSTWHKINMLYTPRSQADIQEMVSGAADPELVGRLQHVITNRLGHALIHKVEEAKIALTDSRKKTISFNEIIKGLKLEFTRAGFNAAIEAQIAAVQKTVATLLAQPRVQGQDIHTIFFTGGSSAVPAVREAICQLLPHAQVVNGDPVAAVGCGLAVDAASRLAA